MKSYKLDRSKSWAGTKAEQDQHTAQYWKQQSIDERFKASWYLTCMAYNIDPDNPPPMDKTVFSVRRSTDG